MLLWGQGCRWEQAKVKVVPPWPVPAADQNRESARAAPAAGPGQRQRDWQPWGRTAEADVHTPGEWPEWLAACSILCCSHATQLRGAREMPALLPATNIACKCSQHVRFKDSDGKWIQQTKWCHRESGLILSGETVCRQRFELHLPSVWESLREVARSPISEDLWQRLRRSCLGVSDLVPDF